MTTGQAFSHRNGESESPTVNGDYWIEYPNYEEPYKFEIDRWVDNTWQHNGQKLYEVARFYGPIPKPNIPTTPTLSPQKRAGDARGVGSMAGCPIRRPRPRQTR